MKKLFLLTFLSLLMYGCEEIPDSAIYNYTTRGLVSHYTFEGNLLDSYGDNNHWHSMTEYQDVPAGWSFGEEGIIGEDFKTNSDIRSDYDNEHILYIYDKADSSLSSDLINDNKPFSISLWFKCTRWHTVLESAGIISWGDKDNNIVMSLDLLTNTRPPQGVATLNFNIPPRESGNSLTSSKNCVDDHSWHHAVITFDGILISLYVDNVVEDSKVRVNIGNIDRVYLGNGGFYYFPGEIDELYFYKVCLTPDEINQLWNIKL